MAKFKAISFFAVAVSLIASPAQAHDAPEAKFPAKPQLQGVERAQADELVRDLEELQAKLRAGERVYFSLLSGAPASYENANLGARDAFLAMDWAKTLNVSEMDPGNSYWTGYRLELLPNGFGKLVWDVRIWRNASGDFARIELFNRPPHPF